MSLISPHHISAYFQCQRKAYLFINSVEEYVLTDYETLVYKSREKVMESYFSKIIAQCYRKDILQEGVHAVSNTKMSFDYFDFDCKLLLKREGKSAFGTFYYEPGIFIGTNKVTKENRMELTFLCYVLEKIQFKFVDKAFLINKKGDLHKLKLTKLKNELKKAITGILDFGLNPPKLILNKHCSQCSFQSLCKSKAVVDDNLTLLDRITLKQVNKLERKGIFTIKQLSFIYKPRRKNKRAKNPQNIYIPELQALAIRTGKTYIQQLPILERKQLEIFLDIESLPDESFFYLFGLLISENEKHEYYSLWSDNLKDEESSWQKLIQFLENYPQSPIYHYGSFESSAFDILSKRYSTDIESLKKRLININTFIFAKIYFPAYSNGLKELGHLLGMKWTHPKATGLQSIVWRNYWEEGQKEYKETILTYNEDDCFALKTLVDELTRIQMTAKVSNDLEFVQNPKKIASEKSNNMHSQFQLVLELAHNEYDSKKIKLDLVQNEIKKIRKKGREKKGFECLNKSMQRPNKTIFLSADEYCFKHTQRKLNKSKVLTTRVLIDLIFSKNGVKKTVAEYIGSHGYCPICNNSYPPLLIREMSRQLYSHNYKAWFVFQRIELQLSFSKIIKSVYVIINDKIGSSHGGEFIKSFSIYYEDTEKQIIKSIYNSPFIHADETIVSISGENQYVWIFTTDKHVTFKLSENRDAITAIDFLKDYKGVLISDFYSGYDAIKCIQQKCWVHLIRDLNNDLWDNPFDIEYENFVSEIRNLILPIIQASQLHGLKKRFLLKYQKYVDVFFTKWIDEKIYQSDLCILYQKRFIRYRDSLFTFIMYDDINWHNNAAENGIRHICVQRKISGSFGANQFPHYLRMVSIMQTCKLQNKSFFKFLLSKEKEIDKFCIKQKRNKT